jgi:hypothetical protein
VEALRKEVSSKANIKDICELIDMKSNIDDVNQIFTEMNTELEGKTRAEEFKAFCKE